MYVCMYLFIHVFVCCLMNAYRENFTIVFIIKLMELSLKIETSHFIVSDIVVTRRVVIVCARSTLFSGTCRFLQEIHPRF